VRPQNLLLAGRILARVIIVMAVRVAEPWTAWSVTASSMLLGAVLAVAIAMVSRKRR
jgi:hypothetical protein